MVWTEDIDKAQHFKTKEEAEEIVNSGWNMECIEYDNAIKSPGAKIPNWQKLEIGIIEARKRMKPKGFTPKKPEKKKEDNAEEVELDENDFVEL